MVSDSTLQLIFKKLSLVEFGFNIKEECSQLSEKAITIALPFPTTYLCEAEYSLFTLIKITYLTRLKAEADIRIQLTSIKPVIKEICKNIMRFLPSTFYIVFHKMSLMLT